MKLLLIFILGIRVTLCTPLTRSDLVLNQTFELTIQKALKFFKNRQRANGAWLYDHLPFEGRNINTGNMVRQAGTFFSLAQAYSGKDEELKETLQKAIGYFEQNSSTFTPIDKTLRIISATNEAYTGTICLFLAGCFWLQWKHPQEFTFQGDFYVQLMDTLAYLYNEGQGLPKLINTKENYVEKLYRDPEAYASVQFFLALTLYHVAYQRKHFHPVLRQLMELYNRKLTPFEVKHTVHWNALVNRLHLEWGQHDWLDEASQMHTAHYAQLKSRWPLQETTANTCSIAEGWAYALRAEQLITGKPNRLLLYRLTRHLRHLQSFQLHEDSAITSQTLDNQSYEQGLRNPSLAVGGFRHHLQGKVHTRIDFTQHCLSAYITHREILRDMFEDKEEWKAFQARKLEEEWIQEQQRKARNKPKRMQRILLKEVQRY